MQSIIIFSENCDLIDSMKQAVSYKQQSRIKFHFYTNLALLQAHFRNIGLPDLLIHDQKLTPQVEGFPENLRTAQLTDRHTTSEKEVFIYQQMDNFIIDVIKMLNDADSPTAFNEAGFSKPNNQLIKLWLLDPTESAWSKMCYAVLERKFYESGMPMVSIDASIYGATHMRFTQANYETLSQHISSYVWDKSSYGEQITTMQQKATSHIIQGVSHPMDALSLDAGFWEQFHSTWDRKPTHHLFYAGLLSEVQLKTLCPYYDRVLIMSQDSCATKEKLNQIHDWFAQVAPQLKIKTHLVESHAFTPEQYVESIWQWIVQREEG